MCPHHLKIRKLLRKNVRSPEGGPIRSGRVIVSQVIIAGRLGCAVINRGGNRLSLADEILKLKPAIETARRVGRGLAAKRVSLAGAES